MLLFYITLQSKIKTMEENRFWFAVYTKPRNEKKVYTRLTEKGIETFLPLQKRLKQWSDRKKIVEEPLFNSYIFVRIEQKDYYEVLNTVGVVRYVTFGGKAATIPERQIEQVKQLLIQDIEIETVAQTFEMGAKVEVKFGGLKGIVGEIVEHSGKKKVLLKIDHISHSLLVSLPVGYIVKSI
jgi:transcription antitermination factor NusG